MQEESPSEGGGSRSPWMSTIAMSEKDKRRSSNSNDRLRLRMTRVDGFNSTVGAATPQRRVSAVCRLTELLRGNSCV